MQINPSIPNLSNNVQLNMNNIVGLKEEPNFIGINK